MSVDVQAFAKAQWADFISSKTLKVILVSEAAAVGGFIESISDGSLHFNRTTLAAFCATQIAAVLVLTLRHALAEIKAHAAGLLPPEAIDTIAQAEQVKVVALLNSKGHTAAAAALETAFQSADASVPLPVKGN